MLRTKNIEAEKLPKFGAAADRAELFLCKLFSLVNRRQKDFFDFLNYCFYNFLAYKLFSQLVRSGIFF